MSGENNDKQQSIEIQGPEAESEGTSGPDEEQAEVKPAEAGPTEQSLQAQLAALEEELASERDAHLRARAELRNYRQRIAKEYAEQAKYASDPLLEALLPTLDHLEMALQAAQDHGEGDTGLAEGVGLTYRQLMATLAQFGLTPIKAEGEFFDPARHEVAERVEVSSGEPCEGTILAELRKGYMLHDRVLRPAQVCVAVEKQAPEA